MTLTSGSTIGARCRCGAVVYSYYISRLYLPDEELPPIEAIPMFWEFVCERGHTHVERQLSLWEEA